MPGYSEGRCLSGDLVHLFSCLYVTLERRGGEEEEEGGKKEELNHKTSEIRGCYINDLQCL